MSNVLFLVHRIPYPPNKGDKIRSFHLTKYLSERHKVYLGGFVDDPVDWKYTDNLQEYCVDMKFVPIRPWRSVVSAARSLLTGGSLSVAYYRNQELQNWADKLIADRKIDIVIVFSSVMAQFIPRSDPRQIPSIADFVDVDSNKWTQFALQARWPKRLVYRYEASALARWELSIANAVDAISLVSREEGKLFSRAHPETSAQVEVIRNGVDLEYFDPAVAVPNPYEGTGPIIVFTGAMDYFANAQGVSWFANTVWPQILKISPGAEFWIVGSNPTSDIKDLARSPGVEVTGRVADIRPYLKHASVAVAPLHLARGVQNKVLEALAMELPVVATPQALQGLDGVMPDTVCTAVDETEFCEEIARLCVSGANDNEGHGRAYVKEYYEWSRNLSVLQDLISSFTGSSNEVMDAPYGG